MKQRAVYAILLGVGIAIGALAVGWVLNERLDQLEALEDRTQVRVLQTGGGLAAASRVFEPTVTFHTAAERTVDAVVFINTRIGDAGGYFADVFGAPREGTGSGVIVSEDGFIVTNNHVVQDASEIRVTFNDLSEYEAEIVATDPSTDLAVIKIDAESLTPLTFANSDDVRIGQWVLAVGNPFRLTSTVTAGIVSAKARNIGILRGGFRGGPGAEFAIESFIQTDAAVNPGNSGGALVNLDGELVGINTAIATETGAYQGYSFAIPSNLVRKVVRDLMEFGAVQRGFLGVVIRDMDQATARRRSIGVRQGAYITELTPNGVGAQAGLQVGDVIVALNNRPVRNASELQEQVANYRPGQDVTLRLMRGTAELNLAVTLRNRQGTTGLAQRKPMGNPTNPDALRQLGGTFAELTAQQLSEHQAAHGVLLRSTDTGSPLARAGVPTGFVLVRVNHQPIRTVADLRRVLGTSTGQVLLEGIKPNGHAAWYVLNLP